MKIRSQAIAKKLFFKPQDKKSGQRQA